MHALFAAFIVTPFLIYVLVGPLPATTRELNRMCNRPGRWWPLAAVA